MLGKIPAISVLGEIPAASQHPPGSATGCLTAPCQTGHARAARAALPTGPAVSSAGPAEANASRALSAAAPRHRPSAKVRSGVPSPLAVRALSHAAAVAVVPDGASRLSRHPALLPPQRPPAPREQRQARARSPLATPRTLRAPLLRRPLRLPGSTPQGPARPPRSGRSRRSRCWLSRPRSRGQPSRP